MKSKLVLRIAVVSEWALFASVLVASSLLANALPVELTSYLDAEASSALSSTEGAIAVVMLVLFPVYVAAAIGLFLLKNWARWTYVFCLLLLYPLTAFLGPVVEHGVVSVLDELVVLCQGLIVGIAFFSNAIDDRVSPPQSEVEI